MAITKTEHLFPNLTGGIIVKSTIPVYIIGKVHTTTVTPRMCVQVKGGSTSNADAKLIIYGGANSKTILGWATFGLTNKLIIGEVTNPALITSAFAANDRIEIALRVPILEALLTTGVGTVLPGARMVCAGAGLLGPHPDSLVSATTTAAATYYLAAAALGIPVDPTVAIMISLMSTADAVQVCQVAPLW